MQMPLPEHMVRIDDDINVRPEEFLRLEDSYLHCNLRDQTTLEKRLRYGEDM